MNYGSAYYNLVVSLGYNYTFELRTITVLRLPQAKLGGSPCRCYYVIILEAFYNHQPDQYSLLHFSYRLLRVIDFLELFIRRIVIQF